MDCSVLEKCLRLPPPFECWSHQSTLTASLSASLLLLTITTILSPLPHSTTTEYTLQHTHSTPSTPHTQVDTTQMSHHGRDSSIASSTSSSHHSSSSPSLTPSGPICTFGPRLAYTYFPSPSPRAELLNSSQQQVHFFTIDDQLLYLSFFQDSGPLNAACL